MVKMDWNEYKEETNRALNAFEFSKEIVDVLKKSKENKQKVFVAGNGGSAAIAMHYVCDFLKKGLDSVCLSDNIAYLTAMSNDGGYHGVFRKQLENTASKNDILILISSSGNSKNIISALEYAKEKGMVTIGISGFDGGKLKELADYSAHINCDSYEITEGIHSVFGHFLAEMLK